MFLFKINNPENEMEGKTVLIVLGFWHISKARFQQYSVVRGKNQIVTVCYI